MFGNAQMGGLNLGFPDVCLTPPAMIPVPYPNVSLGPMGFPPSPTTFWMFTPAHHLMTKPMMSMGDVPGVAGVASGTVMFMTHHVTGSFTTLLNGLPATRMTSMNIQNNTNCPGMTIVPAQFRVLILAP